MNKFSYNLFAKVRFYLSYIYYKITLFKDVRKGFLTIYFAEFLWLVNMIFKTKISLPNKFRLDYFETIYGRFCIYPDLISTIVISPAFEREDINYLIKKMNKSIKQGKKILFLDIGAFIGSYSILVGNRFKRYKKLDIVAFEPSTDYLSKPTISLLKKNIKINKISNIKVKNIGVGSKKGVNKGGININTLSGVLGENFPKKYDEIFIKLDIDDFVMDGLYGILDFVNNSKSTNLFIEDFIERKKVIKFLEKNGFLFEKKYTEYNSFWIK